MSETKGEDQTKADVGKPPAPARAEVNVVGSVGRIVVDARGKPCVCNEHPALNVVTDGSVPPVTTGSGELSCFVLREALREKELLIREVHHRVKNNLQVISSLLSLQGRASMSPEGQRACEESQLRIKSIALIHELLYRSENMSRIEARDYLQKLGTKLLSAFSIGQRVALTVEAEGIFIDLDHAVPFGLVVNELMTNAMKHAFPNQRRGTIQVRLRLIAGGRLHLDFSDDGVGLAADIDPLVSNSLGFRLIGSLVQQLDGRASFSRGSGMVCSIDFPAGKNTEGSI